MLTLAAPNPAPRGSSHRAGRCSEDSSVGLDAPKTPSLPGQAPGWGDTKLDSARTRAPPESGCGWGLLTAPRAPFPADRRLLTQRITHDRPSHVQERGLGHRPLAGRGGEGRRCVATRKPAHSRDTDHTRWRTRVGNPTGRPCASCHSSAAVSEGAEHHTQGTQELGGSQALLHPACRRAC